MIVVIDDERTFDTDEEVIYLRTADEALAWFAKWWTTNENRPAFCDPRKIDQLWFDHDLGPGGDATVVANFLATLNRRGLAPVGEGLLPISTIYIHSQNPVGSQNLWCILSGCASVVTNCGLPPLREG